MRVAVLVIAIKDSFFDSLKEVWERYAESVHGVDVYYLYGGNIDFIGPRDMVFQDVPECLKPGVLDKTMKAFRVVMDLGYDYVVRTNLSTFWNLKKLKDLVLELNEPNTIYGVLREKKSVSHITYASGHAMLIPKSALEMILTNREQFQGDSAQDDFIISTRFSKLGGAIKKANHGKIIESLTSVNDVIGSNIANTGATFFRIKNKTDRSLDVKLHQILYEKIYA